MNSSNLETKNYKMIKILSWTLLIGSVLVLLKILFIHNGYYRTLNNYFATKNFNPPLEYDFSTFLFFAIIEILLCVMVFLSATFVLKFRNLWRNILIYTLVFSVVVLLVSPKIIVISYLWSIILSTFFIGIIIKLSNKEIKVLFK